MNARHIALTSLFATLVLLAGCDTDPSRGKTRAHASPPAPPTGEQAPRTTSVRYTFSQADSKAEFVGAKVTRKHNGSFGAFRGEVLMPDGDPTNGSVSVTIDVASIATDEDDLTEHLKSTDFFDVQQHPKARFVSTSVRPGGVDGTTHTITGNLELHGVTKSISFPAKVRTSPAGVDVDAEFAINRRDFGLTYPGAPDDLIKDYVLVRLTVRARPSET